MDWFLRGRETMSIRWFVLGLMTALSLPLAGCGGDDGDGGGSNRVTAEQAAAGACNDQGMMGGDTTTQCTGIDEYQACLETMCGFDECYEGPACASTLSCLRGSSDPCNAIEDGTCSLSSECTNCFFSKATCATNCISHLDCTSGGAGASGTNGGGGGAGGGSSGGGCAGLDACCASLSGDQKAQCEQQKGTGMLGGDVVCEAITTIFCPPMR